MVSSAPMKYDENIRLEAAPFAKSVLYTVKQLGVWFFFNLFLFFYFYFFFIFHFSHSK